MTTNGYTIKSIIDGFKKKDFSPKEIFDYYIKKIKNENKKLNAYITIFEDGEKKENDFCYYPGKLLFQVPCAIKDNILIENTICTAGSKILENYISTYNSTVIKKLKDAGAVFLGKTNLDEFAMGSSTENSAFGPTKNPYDLTRVAGGSSGGSAAAVAKDLCVFALGSDTGGSIRQPASFCGIVGLKPSYGRVSRYGLIAMASSLDQIGPMTKNVYDSALVLNIISGQDKFDSTTKPNGLKDFTKNLNKNIKGLKIGIPKEYFAKGLSKEVKEVIDKAIKKLEGLGVIFLEISLPHSEYALPAYYIIMSSEVSANLARYDGIKYGYSKIKNGKSKIEDLINVYLKSRAEGFGQEAKRRIMLGTYSLSSGYYEAYYKKAQQVRTLIRKDFEEAFKNVDAIIGPTSPTVAFKIGEKTVDPLSMYLSDIYTIAVNLAGLPAISLPCGFVEKEEKRLPVGLQIIGKYFDEELILQIAYNYEGSN